MSVGLREMGIYKGRQERPASVFCAVDANGGDASLLVEEGGIHDQERKPDVGRGCPMPWTGTRVFVGVSHMREYIDSFSFLFSHGIHPLWNALFSAHRLRHLVPLC
jgi:hypothetical protein